MILELAQSSLGQCDGLPILEQSSRTDRHFRLNPLLSVTAHLRTSHVHTLALPYPSLSLS